ncbi:S-layer family protein, partial [Leptolyngbya sp. FACHB-36]|uniref:S-layer family protein n=1 Tax=Leptolyngbya sp. FACHB-36 TaxID=2692808 RepID=UPI0016815FC7
GNITLNLPNRLLLRRGSSISTTAGKAQGTGDGGNINLAAGFVVAVLGENSDITANAFQGNGGNINITTQGIFGIAFRDRLTLFSDITASSEFGVNGIVTINTPEIDPTQQTPQLPATFSAPPLAQGCRVQGDQTSRFVNAGRGGVPQNPSDPLIPDILWQDLEPIDGPQQATGTAAIVTSSQRTPDSIVEAQGWISRNGAVILTADASTATPYGVGVATGDRCLPQH